MTDSITVTTGARLHFGLLVAGEPDRRTYGGIGLMIDQPRFSLTVRRAAQTQFRGTPATCERISELIPTLGQGTESWDVQVHEEIPAHVGLGSGTQFALAIATAVSRLHGENKASIKAVAGRLGRGTRSIIGTAGFEFGGLISHRYSPQDDPASIPEIIRQDFPISWRFVLITPTGDPGLSGSAERQAFCGMPPMSKQQLQSLGDLQSQLATWARNGDFENFGRLLTMFGQDVGEYFTPFQSGTFASPRMTQLADVLKSNGIQGVGQTSWGPTLFALCETAGDSVALARQIRRWKPWDDCTVRIVAAKNSGAEVITDGSRR